MPVASIASIALCSTNRKPFDTGNPQTGFPVSPWLTAFSYSPAMNQQIKDLESLLNSGATEVVVDGITLKIDQQAIRQRIEDLKAEEDDPIVQRPVMVPVDLGGF